MANTLLITHDNLDLLFIAMYFYKKSTRRDLEINYANKDDILEIYSFYELTMNELSKQKAFGKYAITFSLQSRSFLPSIVFGKFLLNDFFSENENFLNKFAMLKKYNLLPERGYMDRGVYNIVNYRNNEDIKIVEKYNEFLNKIYN